MAVAGPEEQPGAAIFQFAGAANAAVYNYQPGAYFRSNDPEGFRVDGRKTLHDEVHRTGQELRSSWPTNSPIRQDCVVSNFLAVRGIRSAAGACEAGLNTYPLLQFDKGLNKSVTLYP